MRTIKFRYWDSEFKRMTLCDSENTFNMFEQEEDPVMQFTGLVDNLGKEIYEGDILFEEVREYKGVVVFDEGCFQVQFENVIENLSECLDWEIIGDIYSNPELLK